jgi:transcriptional regulator with XRE-family HTH domain
MHIGIRIKMTRIARRITQETLAHKIHKTRPLVSHIEQTGKVSGNTLRLIAKALQVEVEQLQNEAEEPMGLYLTPRQQNRRIQELEDQVKHLISENETMRQLIRTQEEMIALLKGKTERKRK